MSIDINWETITSGPQGEALAESIREFVHEKFQQLTLPGFIRSVQVLSFDFGRTCPQLEIIDIGDPLPDFYDDDEEDGRDDVDDVDNGQAADGDGSGTGQGMSGNRINVDHIKHTSGTQNLPGTSLHSEGRERPRRFDRRWGQNADAVSHFRPPPLRVDDTLPAFRLPFHVGDQPISPFPRSSTPGIPGGTSNLSYFNLPLGGLSGSQTPLAAIASGTSNLHAGIGGNLFNIHDGHDRRQVTDSLQNTTGTEGAGSSRHSTAADPNIPQGSMADERLPQANSPRVHSPLDMSSPLTSKPIQPNQKPSLHHRSSIDSSVNSSRDPSDLQVITHVSYAGDIRLILTAEILLDYPMPSFVSIPLKLSITGLTFDGVAILAWLRKNLYFCFLGEEDAALIVGQSGHDGRDKPDGAEHASADNSRQKNEKPGRLLEEIRVETEIGRKETGKQVLKNVGKVERFVLEQVRRIFEEEFVFPSYWTFLV